MVKVWSFERKFKPMMDKCFCNSLSSKKKVWINSFDCDDTSGAGVFGWEPWWEIQIESEALTTDLPQRGKPLSLSDPALLPPSVRLIAIGHEMREIRFLRTHRGQSKKYSVSFKKNNFTSVSNLATVISSDLQFCIILVHSIFNNDPFDGSLKGSQYHSNGFLIRPCIPNFLPNFRVGFRDGTNIRETELVR